MFVLVFFSQFSAIEIVFLNKSFLCPIEDIDSVKSNLNFFFPIFFTKFWELEKYQFGSALD